MRVRRHFLEYYDRAKNSDKFYQVFITEMGTLTNYGRKGSEGQSQWRTAPNFETAEVFANKKLYEKLDKGYTEAYEPMAFEADHGPGTPSLNSLNTAMRKARSEGSITKMADDLASKAEEFASKVAALISSVRAKLITESEILTSIQEMEADLERTENAIGNARLGLEMARHSLGRSMAQ